MSTWRLMLPRLAALGRAAQVAEFATGIGNRGVHRGGAQTLLSLGLATRTNSGRPVLYEITQLGRDVCEGRAEVRADHIPGRNGRPRLVVIPRVSRTKPGAAECC